MPLLTGALPVPTSMGWEASNLNNNGCSIYFEFTTTVTITGIQVTVAAAPGSSITTGFAEILAYAFLSGPGLTSANFTAPTYQLNTTASNIMSANGTFVTAGGITTAGGGSAQDCLFIANLKEWMDTSAPPCQLQFTEYVPINSVVVTSGDFIVLHIDHGGQGPLDCEMQVSLQGTSTGGVPI